MKKELYSACRWTWNDSETLLTRATIPVNGASVLPHKSLSADVPEPASECPLSRLLVRQS